MKPQETIAIVPVHFVGGPLDGLRKDTSIRTRPGEFYRYGHKVADRQYVYAASGFWNEIEPLRMEYVQLVGASEDVYE